MTKITVIPPKLLHKNAANDVLLTNPRKVTPARFRSEVPRNNNSAIAEIDNLYISDAHNENILRAPSLQGAEVGVSFATVIGAANEGAVRGVPFQVIEKIREGLPLGSSRNLSLDDDAIESFLTYHKISRPSTSFSFVNLADHYFFYRKPHEHIPGIMLLEAARQSIYYQLYTYSKHVLGSVTVSLSELNAKFYAYGDLMYPIEIIIDDLGQEDEHYPRKVHYSTSFYQRGALIAKIDAHALVISMDKFKVVRNACLFDTESFVPLPSTPIISLITSSEMKQSIVSLRKIGKDSCVTSRPKISGLQNAFLTVVYDGSLCFRAPISLLNEDETGVTWTFGQMEYVELEHLKEIIKCSFILSQVNTQPVDVAI
ncbi:MAG: hypothetical protein HHJ12_17715 [Glaciimonas sp.]|nr:hypothetical protein [Glaciimonas sp.]